MPDDTGIMLDPQDALPMVGVVAGRPAAMDRRPEMAPARPIVIQNCILAELKRLLIAVGASSPDEAAEFIIKYLAAVSLDKAQLVEINGYGGTHFVIGHDCIAKNGRSVTFHFVIYRRGDGQREITQVRWIPVGPPGGGSLAAAGSPRADNDNVANAQPLVMRRALGHCLPCAPSFGLGLPVEFERSNLAGAVCVAGLIWWTILSAWGGDTIAFASHHLSLPERVVVAARASTATWMAEDVRAFLPESPPAAGTASELTISPPPRELARASKSAETAAAARSVIMRRAPPQVERRSPLKWMDLQNIASPSPSMTTPRQTPL